MPNARTVPWDRELVPDRPRLLSDGEPPMSEVTRILEAIDRGDARATDRLLPLVYDELRRLAARRLAREAPGQTLQPTGLVHEAYLRLEGGDDPAPWHGRGHFFAAAAEAMRRILVANARRKRRVKHGGARRRVAMDEAVLAVGGPAEELLAVDTALERLAADEPQAAELVKLHYFCGLTIEQAAEAIGVSPRKGHRPMIWMLAFSPDGRPLASLASYPMQVAEVKLCDLAADREMLTLKTTGVDLVGSNGLGNSGFAFSPDGHRLFYLPGGVRREAKVQVWDATPMAQGPAGVSPREASSVPFIE